MFPGLCPYMNLSLSLLLQVHPFPSRHPLSPTLFLFYEDSKSDSASTPKRSSTSQTRFRSVTLSRGVLVFVRGVGLRRSEVPLDPSIAYLTPERLNVETSGRRTRGLTCRTQTPHRHGQTFRNPRTGCYPEPPTQTTTTLQTAESKTDFRSPSRGTA